MFILKRPLKINGKQFQMHDTVPDDFLPSKKIQTLLNVGHIASGTDSELTNCEGCDKKFIKKTHNQKYCSKKCRKA